MGDTNPFRTSRGLFSNRKLVFEKARALIAVEIGCTEEEVDVDIDGIIDDLIELGVKKIRPQSVFDAYLETLDGFTDNGSIVKEQPENNVEITLRVSPV